MNLWMKSEVRPFKDLRSESNVEVVFCVAICFLIFLERFLNFFSPLDLVALAGNEKSKCWLARGRASALSSAEWRPNGSIFNPVMRTHTLAG